MKSKYEIVDHMARERQVETLAQNIAHKALDADLRDLCQMVYLSLLTYDEGKIQDLWKNKQMPFFVARVLINQFRSSNSPFHTIYRKFSERSSDISLILEKEDSDK